MPAFTEIACAAARAAAASSSKVDSGSNSSKSSKVDISSYGEVPTTAAAAASRFTDIAALKVIEHAQLGEHREHTSWP